MNNIQQSIIVFDGTDEIIFSSTYNVYENKLVVKSILGYDFIFEFENTEPKSGQKDINTEGSGKSVTLTFSKKFRNTLGSGTVNKIQLVKFKDGRLLLFSIYGSTIGDNSNTLNITINFYLRKT